jgi:ketosteroid isomerase-like protein
VVTGHYQAGIKGKTDKVEIPFLHLWEVRDEKLALCRSFTDTALVQKAVKEGGERSST